MNNDEDSVEISVPAEKIEEWLKLAKSLRTEPLVSYKSVEQFTGKMAWASGFVLQLRPFVRMLHAALATAPQRDRVYYRQVKPALDWLEAYLLEQRGGVRKLTVAHARHVCRLDFYVDASPTGGGAVRLEEGRPVETFALTWTKEDEKALEATIGDPGSQALWEAYMMLRCLWHWMSQTDQGFIRIRGCTRGSVSLCQTVGIFTTAEPSSEGGGAATSHTPPNTRGSAHLERDKFVGGHAVPRRLPSRVAAATKSTRLSYQLAPMVKQRGVGRREWFRVRALHTHGTVRRGASSYARMCGVRACYTCTPRGEGRLAHRETHSHTRGRQVSQ